MTLIEMMIVVGIVAILGSIAINSYRSSVIRSNRAEATAALLRIQAAQEKYYLSRNTYTSNLALLGSSNTTERGLYTLRVDNATTTGYTARATATGSQAVDTDCAVFTITETGARTPAPTTGTRCWR